MKCPKCGLEFEGKFCPECGTPAEPVQQKCPSCGRIRQDGEKFCSACGYSWEENVSQTEPPKEPENKLAKVCRILPRVPAFAFALFSVLVFIFFCAPVVNIFGIGYGSVYSRSEDLPSLDGSLITLIILAVIGILVAAAAVTAGFLPQFKYKKFTAAGKTFSLDIVIAAVCCLILLIYFIIGCVICGIISAEGEGTGLLTAGAAPILIIVFSLLFIIVCGGAPVALMLIYKKNPSLKAEAEQVAAEQTAQLNDGASGAGAAVQAGAVKQNKAAVFIKSHKKLTAIIALALVVVIALGVTLGILLGGKDDEDIFSINKVSDIEIGGTQNSVANALGDPYEYTDSEWVYYSSEYADILDELTEVTEQYKYTDSWSERASLLDQQMELYEKLETTVYKTITIYFESTESDTGEIVYTVSSIYFDADCCDSYAYTEKTLENVTILSGEVTQYSSSAEITYEAKFTDGSYVKNSVTATPTAYAGYITESIGSKTELTWSDNWHSGYATTYTVNDIVSYRIVDTTLYVYKNDFSLDDTEKTSVTEVVIDNGVTSIDEGAFDGCTSLESVYYGGTASQWASISFGNASANPLSYAGNLYINETLATDITLEDITSINAYAFYNCISLTSVTIGSDITSIGRYAFYNCTALTEINFNATAMNDFSSFGYVFAYAGQSGDGVTVTLGANVTKIPAYLFYVSYYITSVVFEDGSVCTSIGKYAFSSCTKLTSITIPDSVTSIGEGAFYDCKLTSVTLGSSVKTIGRDAFFRCTKLNSITVSSGNTYYKSIDGNLYSYDGTELIQYAIGKTDTYFEVPSSVATIGYEAFYDCASLSSISIPDSVTSIGSCAFYNCTSLSSITIGSGITSIGEFAFFNTAYYNNSNWEDDVLYIGTCLIKADISGDYEIKDGTTCIADCAFYYCYDLTSITIPNSVTSIGGGAFLSCYSLTSITIGNGVTYIGGNAFFGTAYYDNNDNWVDDVLYIGTCLIEANYVSDDYEIKDGTICIADYAFFECYSLKSITMPDSVTSIGSYAFSECFSLESIAISEKVTYIGSYAFYHCGELTNVTFENTNGWRISTSSFANGTDVGVTDASENVTYLTNTYYKYYWYRSES